MIHKPDLEQLQYVYLYDITKTHFDALGTFFLQYITIYESSHEKKNNNVVSDRSNTTGAEQAQKKTRV